MNLPIPILPFKFVGFTQCTHVITFLDDNEYNSIEFMSYDNSVSGEGIELIITDKSNNQTIFANNVCSFLNIMKSGREVYKSDIELEMSEKNSLVSVALSCKSEIHNVQLLFESMFPISDLRAGKIDTKRHSNQGMPFMYSSQSTVGKRTDIYIDGRKIQVKYSKDPMLSEINGLQSYLSKNFNLGVITVQDSKIILKANKDNKLYYQTSNGDVISFIRDKKIGVMKYSNYVDKCQYEFIYSNGNELETINLNYEGKTTLQVIFKENSNSKQKMKLVTTGELLIRFVNCPAQFNCSFLCDSKIEESEVNENMVITTYTIKHENEDWEEKVRVLKLTVLYRIQKSDGLVKEAIIKDVDLKRI